MSNPVEGIIPDIAGQTVTIVVDCPDEVMARTVLRSLDVGVTETFATLQALGCEVLVCDHNGSAIGQR